MLVSIVVRCDWIVRDSLFVCVCVFATERSFACLFGCPRCLRGNPCVVSVISVWVGWLVGWLYGCRVWLVVVGVCVGLLWLVLLWLCMCVFRCCELAVIFTF